MTSHAAGPLMLEYDKLKDEQNQRIGFRDNLIYATLIAAAAVITGTQQMAARAQLLLALPPVCVVLGWTYLANDQKVSAIGQYLRRELIPRLSEHVGAPVFGWEFDHHRDGRRRQRKRIQLAVDLATFCATPLAALIFYLTTAPLQAPLLAVAAVEAVATVGLAWQIASYMPRHAAARSGDSDDY